MLKKLSKIGGLLLIVALAIGMIFMASCSYYSYGKLDYDEGEGEVSSQGGFLVEKGDYIYFVNGDASYTESNKFGGPVRGALMRISKSALAACNYSDVETVVPLLMYSGSKDAGLFIYGDYVYYTTPATERNSDGEVLNSKLDFKSSKLDGTETMKGRYLQLESNTDEYRYVEVDGVVYILYVATDEQLYDDMDKTTDNIHSLNTETGVDTVLAYDVESYIFDDEDVTNPRIYYTMNVENYTSHSNYSYNQVYTVTADTVEDEENPKYENLESITGWITEEKATEDDDDDIDEWDVYINLGDMVFDGIGKMDVVDPDEDMTMFNWGYQFKDETNKDWWQEYCNDLRLTYVLTKYTNGTLFFLSDTDNTSNYLYKATESDILSGSWNPVEDNPERNSRILADGADAAYNYLFLFDDDGEFTGVIEAGSTDINVNYVGDDGKLGTKLQAKSSQESSTDEEKETDPGKANGTAKYYTIAKDTVATILFTETDTIMVDGQEKEVDYLYYSTSGGNGVAIYRVCYTGVWQDYHEMPLNEDDEDEFTPTQIFDVDAVSDWYTPEMVDDQLIFAADSDDMSSYNYLMVADLRHVENGEPTEYMMGNKELSDLNDKMDDIAESIGDYSAEKENGAYTAQSTYANLENAIWFAYYTGDAEYIHDLAEMCNEAAWDEDETADPVYSETTLKIYDSFINCTGDVWSDYADDYKTINGEIVQSNRRDYYYTLFGVMDDDEADDYMDGLKSTWLQDEPDYTWWEGLSTGAKAGFIVGMCLIGLVVIAAAVLIPILLVSRRRKRNGTGGRQKIAVSLAVDEGVDVYSESLKESGGEGKEESEDSQVSEETYEEPSEDEDKRDDE